MTPPADRLAEIAADAAEIREDLVNLRFSGMAIERRLCDGADWLLAELARVTAERDRLRDEVTRFRGAALRGMDALCAPRLDRQVAYDVVFRPAESRVLREPGEADPYYVRSPNDPSDRAALAGEAPRPEGKGT